MGKTVSYWNTRRPSGNLFHGNGQNPLHQAVKVQRHSHQWDT